jgi:signal transduction histidine kinase
LLLSGCETPVCVPLGINNGSFGPLLTTLCRKVFVKCFLRGPGCNKLFRSRGRQEIVTPAAKDKPGTILGAYLIVAHVSRPLRHLTTAATRLGHGESLEPLIEDGLAEVRGLTRAFNQMAADLAHLEADRKLLLAGVSHDLRTPLSRLRLAVEMLPDAHNDETKRGMVQDIEDMDAVIAQFTAFVRQGEGEPKTAIDLDELVRGCLERYARAGRSIGTRLMPLPRLALRMTSMQRLISNLVDNALKHGVRNGAGAADIEVHTCSKAAAYI